jgi:hypothetical protein
MKPLFHTETFLVDWAVTTTWVIRGRACRSSTMKLMNWVKSKEPPHSSMFWAN